MVPPPKRDMGPETRVPPEVTWDQRLGYLPGKDLGPESGGRDWEPDWGTPPFSLVVNKLKTLPLPDPSDAGGNYMRPPHTALTRVSLLISH